MAVTFVRAPCSHRVMYMAQWGPRMLSPDMCFCGISEEGPVGRDRRLVPPSAPRYGMAWRQNGVKQGSPLCIAVFACAMERFWNPSTHHMFFCLGSSAVHCGVICWRMWMH